MKFFLDTASVKEIREGVGTGLIDGVTTNPSLVAKEGRPFKVVLAEICEIVPGPVSAECVTMTTEEMIAEARDLAKVAKNIVVKIPLTKDGLRAVKRVSAEGIKTNVTLCFSAVQALIAAKAGATYISPFVGRLDDRGSDGMELIRDIRTIYDNYEFQTQILVASIRHPVHVLDAARMGADVSTMPSAVFEKLYQHPLTDLGLAQFLEDWKKVPRT